MTTSRTYDFAVIGGGIIGAAIAWGLVRHGLSVVVLDGDDGDFRASAGNFGLIAVQGKAAGTADYVAWTHRSAILWKEAAAELADASNIDFALNQKGGLQLYVSEADAEKRRRQIDGFGPEVPFPIRFLDRPELLDFVPRAGSQVVGASFCALDGELNPLLFLSALHRAITTRKGTLLYGAKVSSVRPQSGGSFLVETPRHTIAADRVVVAAGLGSAAIAAALGIDVRLFPQRGQIIVTERVNRFLLYPNTAVRQTADGTVMLGSTQENVGFDKSVTLPSMQAIAQRATRFFPCLRQVKAVRAWGCLRVMTPDGAPIYDQSEAYPGLFFATAHSGVTLAAAHILALAPAIAAGNIPPELLSFRADRFAADAVHGLGSEH